jgi:hypothetical protein
MKACSGLAAVNDLQSAGRLDGGPLGGKTDLDVICDGDYSVVVGKEMTRVFENGLPEPALTLLHPRTDGR